MALNDRTKSCPNCGTLILERSARCVTCAARARDRRPLWIAEDRGYVTPCHVWQRGLNHAGYGQTEVNQRPRTAHLAAWEAIYGPVPDGFELDHLCRVRPCVNVDHLEVVTHTENMRRASCTKLTPEAVVEIRALHGIETKRAIAARFGVSVATIKAIHTGRLWKDVA